MVRKTALAALVIVIVVVTLGVAAFMSWAVGGVGTPAGTARNVSAAPKEVGAPDETFYVVAYHWGWGVFKKDGTELDKIRVKKGTTVDIYAVNDHAEEALEKLPAPVAQAILSQDWEERTIEAVEKGLIPAPGDMTIEEALGKGHEEDEDNHDEDAKKEDMHDEDIKKGDVHDEEVKKEDAHDEEVKKKDGQDQNASQKPEPLWPFLEDHGFLIHQYGVVEYLDAHAHDPVRVVFRADIPGSFQFICTNYCGYGHKYQPQAMLIVE